MEENKKILSKSVKVKDLVLIGIEIVSVGLLAIGGHRYFQKKNK